MKAEKDEGMGRKKERKMGCGWGVGGWGVNEENWNCEKEQQEARKYLREK